MRNLRMAALLTTVLALLPVAARADTQREWTFDVHLEDKPIGTQVFRLAGDGSRLRLNTEASFDVKILFFTAYTYRHSNEEIWEGGCLASIRSTTDDNGKPFRVSGERGADGFVVETGAGNETLPACVQSFAYWDAERLRAPRLLNSQTGEYETVALREIGREMIELRGTPVPAERIALEGPTLRIDLWYSPEGDWLGLESASKGGRRLRYVRK